MLLDSAAKVLSERGYSKTRLSDIAVHVGIHPASTYYHFKSKEELVREVLKLAWSRGWHFVSNAVDALPANATPVDRLATGIRAHIRVILEMSDYVSAAIRVAGEVPADIYRGYVADQKKYNQYWDKLFDAAQSSGQVRSGLNLHFKRALLIGTMAWSLEWYTPNRGLGADDIADEIIDTFFNGIASSAAGRRLVNAPARKMSRDTLDMVANGQRG